MPSLQVVVLAGNPDAELATITEAHTKCAIPIHRQTLLNLHLASIRRDISDAEILIACPAKQTASVSTLLKNGGTQVDDPQSPTPVRVVPNDGDSPLDALKSLEEELTEPDVIVLSVDTLGPQYLQDLLCCHKKNNALASVLFVTRECTSSDPKASTKHRAGHQPAILPPDAIATTVEPSCSRILALRSLQETQHGEPLKIPTASLQSVSGPVTVETCYRDPHIYIFRTSVLKHVLSAGTRAELESIRLDLLPLLVAFQSNMRELDDDAKDNGTICYHCVEATPRLRLPRRISAADDLLDVTLKFCVPRATDALRDELLVEVAPECPKPRGVGKDAVIEKDVHFGESVTVKRSNLGANTRVEAGCRVTSSVLGRDVSVGSKCIVDQSVIGNGVTLEDGCQLTRCVVEAGAVVRRGASLQNSHVTRGHDFDDGFSS